MTENKKIFLIPFIVNSTLPEQGLILFFLLNKIEVCPLCRTEAVLYFSVFLEIYGHKYYKGFIQ